MSVPAPVLLFESNRFGCVLGPLAAVVLKLELTALTVFARSRLHNRTFEIEVPARTATSVWPRSNASCKDGAEVDTSAYPRIQKMFAAYSLAPEMATPSR